MVLGRKEWALTISDLPEVLVGSSRVLRTFYRVLIICLLIYNCKVAKVVPLWFQLSIASTRSHKDMRSMTMSLSLFFQLQNSLHRLLFSGESMGLHHSFFSNCLK